MNSVWDGLKSPWVTWALILGNMLVLTVFFGGLIVWMGVSPRVGYGRLPNDHHWVGMVLVLAALVVPRWIPSRFRSTALTFPMALFLVGIDYTIVPFGGGRVPHPLDMLGFFVAAILLVVLRYPKVPLQACSRE